MASPQAPLLSPEELAQHAQTCEVIFAMWGGQDELQIDEQNEKAVELLAKYLALPVADLGSPESVAIKEDMPASIDFALVLSPFAGSGKQTDNKLLLDVSLPTRKALNKDLTDVRPRLHLRQAPWLDRQGQELLRKHLSNDIETTAEDDGSSFIMNAVESLCEAATSVPMNVGPSEMEVESHPPTSGSVHMSPMVLRTWHHLPSLSTKEKRDDLCSYASATLHQVETGGASSAQPLTGFVLAGKPGLVVIECPLPSEPVDPTTRASLLLSATQAIDSYWSDIKARSWADIPSGHKKVSETLREEFASRAFSDMQEITGSEEIGGKQAMRGGWRNDMSKIEGWLKTKGVGGRLRDVLSADW